MIAPRELRQANAWLAVRELDDLRVALFRVQEWLCPDGADTFEIYSVLRMGHDAAMDYAERHESGVTHFLMTAQEFYPDIYREGLHRITTGQTYEEVERYLYDAFNGMLVESDGGWLEGMMYGPPLWARGVDYWEYEWWNSDYNEDWMPILEAFGMAGAYDHNEWDSSALQAMANLEDSLMPPCEDWKARLALCDAENATPQSDVAWMLAYLHSSTDNVLLDWSITAIYVNGGDYPGWSPDDVAWVNEQHDEANCIEAAIHRGRSLLLRNDDWFEALTRNIELAKRSLKSDDDPDYRWPDTRG